MPCTTTCPQPDPNPNPNPNPNPDPNPNPNPDPNPNPNPPPPVVIYPQLLCSDPTTLVYWSDATIWKDGVVPIAGDNVTIPGECYIFMDVSVENLYNLTISGRVLIKDTDITLSSYFIWVKQGVLQAGN